MSRQDRDTSKPGDRSADDLLGDLESIKELLDEEQAQARDRDAGVPLLDDMVDGAYELTDSASLLAATPALGSGNGNGKSRYLPEDIFDALLGDRWKSSATDILTEARGAIEAYSSRWTPEDTDELNEALRVRIDETLTEWLKATVAARVDELHAELLRAAETVIDEKIRALIDTRLDDGSTED
ncbi:MAG: hypothetical protein PVH91_03515 [Pseudomonadales bacterium]|jgi:hypothetical protein